MRGERVIVMMINSLSNAEKFSRQDYIMAYKDQFGDKNTYAIEYALRKSVADGEIIHIGRDQYTVNKARSIYRYKYTEEAVQIASEIMEEYPAVDFRLFELRQLNAFVNHLYAHNTIFVFVESDVIDFVFDYLHNEHPGRVMLKPRPEEYFRYLVSDQVVILKLPSEAPKGIDEVWHSRIEKMLVDISVDKLLSKIVSASEYNAIFTGVYERYYIDENAMFRYANRRGAGKKFRTCMKEYLQSEKEV